MEKLVLSNYPEPLLQVRILDSHSPKTCNLENCSTLEEAWAELDHKYGNVVNAAAKLVDEFLKFRPTGKSDETKLDQIKNAVTALNCDLTAVNHQSNLHENAWLLGEIIKLLPKAYAIKFTNNMAMLMGLNGTLWSAL